ncbi:MAG: YqcC family protein [Actinomycetota bacterium]|nr:YqcC family protein [Actinomycetota bacterium]
MDAELYEWMAPTIEAVQPYCDEPLIAAGTFQVAGGWASAASGGVIGALLGTVLRRTPKHVRERGGGLPDTIVLAVGRTKVYVFPYRTRRMRLDTGPPARVWRRNDVAARSDVRMVASKLTIDVASKGDHHELESTSMTGRLGKITKEIFRLLDNPAIGAPTPARHTHPPRESTKKADAKQRRLGEVADEIEAELKRLRWWIPDPPSEETVVAGGAFGMNAVAFPTWLQVVFVRRLRQAAAGEFAIPSSSSVSTFAIREFDGYADDTGRLMDLLHEVDRLV